MDDNIEHIDEEDIIQVIELDDSEGVVGELGDVTLHSDGDDRVGEDDLDDDDVNDDDGEIDGDVENMEASAEDIRDMADFIFSKHTDAVFSVSLDPKSCDIAVTGGQDDKAYVWQLSTGEVILECSGHKDSVTCTGFSHDGQYVATADLSGLVKVWRVDTREEVWSFECSDAEWMRWHPMAHVLLLGTVDGDVWMWKIPSGECKTFQSSGHTTSCGLLMNDGKRACAGYDDGSLKIWDLKSGTPLHTISGHEAHKSTVICVACNHDDSLLMTGSTDVTSKLLTASSGKVIATLDCQDPGGDSEDSVEAVGFSPVQNYAATGSLSGKLRIWDVSTQVCRHTCNHEAGIVGLCWDRLSPLVYTSCLDGIVRLWDARSGQMSSQWTGHTDSILDFSITKDNNTLVTVSEDQTARVFSLHMPER